MTKELVQYLKDAIIIKGKINIPRLGTFIGEYKSAQKGENNALLPPVLHLQFTEKANKEDENIINYLVYEASLPKELANQMVKHFIQEVKSSLASNRSAVIGDMGKLHYDAKQRLVFTANEKSNFYAMALGMESNVVSVAGKKSRNKRKQAAVKKKRAKVQATGEQIPKVKKLWPVWVVVILLLISVPLVTVYIKGEKEGKSFTKELSTRVMAVWTDLKSFSDNLDNSGLLSQNNTENTTNNVSAEKTIDNSLNYEQNDSLTNTNKIDSTKLAENIASVSKKEPITETKEKPKNTEKNEKAVDKHYSLTGISEAKLSDIKITPNTEIYLIAGSFRNRENAKRLQEELIGMGYEALVLDAGSGLNRVALGKFKSVKKAYKTFERFHQKRPKVGVWLLTRE